MQHGGDQHRAPRHQMLAVVHDEQHLPIGEETGEHLRLIPVVLVGQPQRARDRAGQQFGIRELSQFDHPHPVPERPPGARGDAAGEPGLSHSADAGERDKTSGRQQSPDLRDFLTAPDKGAQFSGQTARG